MRSPSRGALALLLLLGACGDLPQPYRGRPGGMAAQLAQPPAARIAIAPPIEALLTDEGGSQLADSLAAALQAAELPATAAEPLPLDWRLDIAVDREGSSVTPRYRLADADGVEVGIIRGSRVPVQSWADGGPEPLRRAAAEAAPRIIELVARAEAARKATDPRAMAGAVPRIRLVPVRGAPGDGNSSLTARMREFLTNRGYLVQDGGEGAGFAVEGTVALYPSGRPGEQRVEIEWKVSRRDGYELGKVTQINAVPAGSLNGLWGDIAFVVAEQAAGGIRDVIRNAVQAPPTVPEPPPVTPIR